MAYLRPIVQTLNQFTVLKCAQLIFLLTYLSVMIDADKDKGKCSKPFFFSLF